MQELLHRKRSLTIEEPEGFFN